MLHVNSLCYGKTKMMHYNRYKCTWNMMQLKYNAIEMHYKYKALYKYASLM